MQLENLPAVATALQAGGELVRAHEADGIWNWMGL